VDEVADRPWLQMGDADSIILKARAGPPGGARLHGSSWRSFLLEAGDDRAIRAALL